MNRTLPPPLRRRRGKCERSIPGIGSGRLVPPPSRPTTIRPPSATARKPRTFHAGHRLDGLNFSSLLPHAPPSFTDDNLSPFVTIQEHHRPLLRPKTSVGSISAHHIATGYCWPAPENEPWALALLLDRCADRPSFSPAPTTGAPVFTLIHPPSDSCFSRAVIAPSQPLETMRSPATTVFPASSCRQTSKIIEPSPLPCDDSATRVSSSSDLCRGLPQPLPSIFCPNLRSHLAGTVPCSLPLPSTPASSPP